MRRLEKSMRSQELMSRKPRKENPEELAERLHFHMSRVTIALGQSAKDEGQFCVTGQLNNRRKGRPNILGISDRNDFGKS